MISFIIIEDDLAARYLLKETVSRMGHEVIAAVDNIAAAIAYLKSGKVPTIILLDIVLPGGLGTSLIDYVKTNHKDVKIVLVTGLSEERIFKLIKPGSYDAILPKPFLISDLAKIIDTILKSPGAKP